ncbi:MAG: hypothetical protein WEC81_01890 [Patescibacteria group bacterium]
MIERLKKQLSLRDEETGEFKYGKFFAFYIVQYALFVALGLSVFSSWENTFQSPWYSYVAWFVGTHFVLSGFEWGYHRYLLHTVVARWFKSQCEAHTLHHSHTDVTTIKNQYEIRHSHQNEAATFPVYALSAFCAVFTPLIWGLQYLLPAAPVIIGGYSGVMFSLVLYEVYHAVMHLEYDRYWRRWVEKFHLVRQLYGFHLMHHASIRINQAIGGFFFLPIWDWVFGTYFVPTSSLPLPGQELPQPIPKPPPARWLTRKLDKITNNAQKRVVLKSRP